MAEQLLFPDLRAIWNNGHPRSLQADVRFQGRELHLIGALVCDKETADSPSILFEVQADHRVRLSVPACQAEVFLGEEDLLQMLSRVVASRQYNKWQARLQALVAAKQAA